MSTPIRREPGSAAGASGTSSAAEAKHGAGEAGSAAQGGQADRAAAAAGDQHQGGHKAGFKPPWQAALDRGGGAREAGQAQHDERAREEANAQRLSDILQNERSKRV